MIARHPDAIGAALIVLVAIAVLAGGLTTPDPGFGVVAPATFPVVLGILMLVSAAWLVFEMLTRRREPTVEPLARRAFASTAICYAVFLTSFIPLGFVISATTFLIVQSRVFGSRTLARDAIVSLLFVLALYWLFVGFLTIDLPNGPLPF